MKVDLAFNTNFCTSFMNLNNTEMCCATPSFYASQLSFCYKKKKVKLFAIRSDTLIFFSCI